jgi:hypothetical protein
MTMESNLRVLYLKINICGFDSTKATNKNIAFYILIEEEGWKEINNC